MMVDFGVDPRCIDTMCMAEIQSIMVAMAERRGKVSPPSAEVRKEKMDEFMAFLALDPTVRIV